MDEKLIYSLWDRFDKSDAVELVYESGDGRIKLRKAESTEKQIFKGCITSDSTSAGNVAGDSHAEETKSDDAAVYVKSPIPGTFYRSASPDDEPYVMIGSKVKQGDVIGIVESMKMMNEIVASADGTVAEILAENGSIVGYDDKLIRLDGTY